MEQPTFEKSLLDYLTDKYPDENPEQLAERFEAINNRRLYLVRHSGKSCSGCNEFKALTEYGMDAREQDGLHTKCKDCRQERRTQ